MQNMERLLCVWIEDQTKRRMPLSLAVIQEKARSLWNDLKKKQEAEGKGEGAETFTASRGWFMRFCRRANLHNLKCRGEAASADHAAASEFPAKLKKIIEEGGYSPKQVYNIDETGLFWKRMPSRTYIAREEKTAPGFKAAKDRLTLLLGGNAEGDVKLKPLLVYVSENPRALKGCLKAQLPVIWRSNTKAWMTGALTHDYVINYFSKHVEKYSKEKCFGVCFEECVLFICVYVKKFVFMSKKF